MSTNIDTKAQQAMQKALDAFKRDKSSVKEFYPCSQELSTWLQEKAKS